MATACPGFPDVPLRGINTPEVADEPIGFPTVVVMVTTFCWGHTRATGMARPTGLGRLVTWAGAP